MVLGKIMEMFPTVFFFQFRLFLLHPRLQNPVYTIIFTHSDRVNATDKEKTLLYDFTFRTDNR